MTDSEITKMVRAATAELLSGRMDDIPDGYIEVTDYFLAQNGIGVNDLMKEGGERNAKWRCWRIRKDTEIAARIMGI